MQTAGEQSSAEDRAKEPFANHESKPPWSNWTSGRPHPLPPRGLGGLLGLDLLGLGRRPGDLQGPKSTPTPSIGRCRIVGGPPDKAQSVREREDQRPSSWISVSDIPISSRRGLKQEFARSVDEVEPSQHRPRAEGFNCAFPGPAQEQLGQLERDGRRAGARAASFAGRHPPPESLQICDTVRSVR